MDGDGTRLIANVDLALLSEALSEMPVSSALNSTRMLGCPLGIGGMPEISNLPSCCVILELALSPQHRCSVIWFCPSSPVEKICEAAHGSLLPFARIIVNLLPKVSMPTASRRVPLSVRTLSPNTAIEAFVERDVGDVWDWCGADRGGGDGCAVSDTAG